MRIYLSKWIKNTMLVSLLMVATLAEAAIGDTEQQLLLSGGNSVAISGDWGFVGDADNECSVYVYKYDATTHLWGDGAGSAGVPKQTISGNGGCKASPYREFGASISVSHDLLVVGAPDAKDGGSINPGRVFFYVLDTATDTWVENTTVGFAENPDGSSDEQDLAHFGATVSVRYAANSPEAILLIGAPDYDVGVNINSTSDYGKAYMYVWDSITETLVYVEAVEGSSVGDHLGSAVTSNGTHFLVSSPYSDENGQIDNGKVELFSFDITQPLGSKFSLVQTFLAGDATVPDGAVKDFHLGISLSLSQDGVMLLGGSDATILNEGSDGNYTYVAKKSFTSDGDVSQSHGMALFGYTGRSIHLYNDSQNIGLTPDGTVTNNLTGYGRDVTITSGLDGARLMVNGDGGTGNPNNRAYSYYDDENSCTMSGALTANIWQVIGLQCEVYKTDGITKAGIGEIYSDLGTYGVDWGMYSREAPNYDGHSSSYTFMNAIDSMQVGVGYWIIWLGTGGGNGTYALDETLKATNVVKEADPLSRIDVSAVSVTDIQAIMTVNGTENPIGRDGVSGADMRVLLANQLKTPVTWSETLLTEDTVNGIASNTVGNFPTAFEGDNVEVYTYDPDTDGWKPVVLSAGMGYPTHIDPGQGFNVKFSSTLHTKITDADTNALYFQFAEEK